MSDSDWLERPKVRLALSVLLAGFTVAAYWTMFYSAGYNSGSKEQRAREERQHYAAETSNRVQRECPQTPTAAFRECVTDIVDAERESQRSESDLAAQWKAADWVFWAAIIAGVQVLITLIGTTLLYEQIRLTRKAVKDTSDATDAMRKQSEIAVKTLRTQVASSRPIMVFDLENSRFVGPPFPPPWDTPEHKLDRHIEATFGFKNVGNQPCWIMSTWFTFYIAAHDDRGQINIPDNLPDWFRAATSGFVIPGQSVAMGGGFYGVQKSEIDIIEKGGGVIVFGMCQYKSLSGNVHCTRYGYKVPIQRPHNTSLDKGYPIDKPSYWRDGLVSTVKLDHADPTSWIEE